ncbi:sensor histidine kinase [Streptomyces purpureus]|uniref:histidine kinase n=1 Tax=Streptomyces purpureus TaxID=1951 RepID=A0A918GY66_9ACTN|nr:ATP-binding protein [Streptomyces purpureus]GGT20347.1 two-component sensor histidine kinase [Streptomyces purpureus]
MIGPGSTIRTRVALVFGGVFLVLGTCLLTVVNLLSRAGTQDRVAQIRSEAVPALPAPAAGQSYDLYGEGTSFSVVELTDTVQDAAGQQMLIWSGFALLATALCAVAVGWWTAGRVLRPVHEMTARARRLSERNLHERIAAVGPDDELKHLGDTIDALLGRLETAFDSQRRFIANASHELRTPLATQRTAIQVGLDETASAEELAATKQLLLDSNRRSERLIEGLLVLARSERGLEERDDVDLADVVAEECRRHGVAFDPATAADHATAADPAGATGAAVRGNRLLLAQLVRNLLANAVAYNVPDGFVRVTVCGGQLVVANTGPEVRAEDIPGLFEPFRRGEGRDRMGPGAGLGLSIVRSITVAHGGTVTAEPGPGGGGLAVTVTLPVTL